MTFNEKERSLMDKVFSDNEMSLLQRLLDIEKDYEMQDRRHWIFDRLKEALSNE